MRDEHDVLRRDRIGHGQCDNRTVVGLDGELGDERRAEPRAHEREERSAVDLAKSSAPVGRAVVRQARVAPGDHRQAAEVAKRDRAAPPAEVRVGGDGDDEALGEHGLHVEPVLSCRTRCEGRVERATVDELHELLGGRTLEELDALFRIALPEALERRREEGRRDRAQRAEPEARGPPARHEVGLGRVDDRHDRLGVLEEEAAGRRQPGRLGRLRAVDEALADEPLQRGDLLADGRLGVPEATGGAPEGSLDCDRHQGLEVLDLEADRACRLVRGAFSAACPGRHGVIRRRPFANKVCKRILHGTSRTPRPP